jgi:hypothetical protein
VIVRPVLVDFWCGAYVFLRLLKVGIPITALRYQSRGDGSAFILVSQQETQMSAWKILFRFFHRQTLMITVYKAGLAFRMTASVLLYRYSANLHTLNPFPEKSDRIFMICIEPHPPTGVQHLMKTWNIPITVGTNPLDAFGYY